MKKFFKLGLVALTVLTLASCAKKEESSGSPSENNTSVTKSKDVSVADIANSKKPILAFSVYANHLAYNEVPNGIYVFQKGKVQSYRIYTDEDSEKKFQFKSLLKLSDEEIIAKVKKQNENYIKNEKKHIEDKLARYSSYKTAQELTDKAGYNSIADNNVDGDEAPAYDSLSPETKQELEQAFNENYKPNLEILKEIVPNIELIEKPYRESKIDKILVTADSTGNNTVFEKIKINGKEKRYKYGNLSELDARLNNDDLLMSKLNKEQLKEQYTVINESYSLGIDFYSIGAHEFTILDTKLKGYAEDKKFKQFILFRVDNNSNINYVLDKVSDDRVELDD